MVWNREQVSLILNKSVIFLFFLSKSYVLFGKRHESGDTNKYLVLNLVKAKTKPIGPK